MQQFCLSEHGVWLTLTRTLFPTGSFSGSLGQPRHLNTDLLSQRLPRSPYHQALPLPGLLNFSQPGTNSGYAADQSRQSQRAFN